MRRFIEWLAKTAKFGSLFNIILAALNISFSQSILGYQTSKIIALSLIVTGSLVATGSLYAYAQERNPGMLAGYIGSLFVAIVSAYLVSNIGCVETLNGLVRGLR